MRQGAGCPGALRGARFDLIQLRCHGADDRLRRPGIEGVERNRRGSPKPRELALRELSRRCNPAGPQRGGVDLAIEMTPRLAIPDRPHRRERRVERMLRAQRFQFAHQPIGEHDVEPLRDRIVQPCTARRHEGDGDPGAEWKGLASPLQRGKRRSRSHVHLERTLDALRVAGLESRGARRVDACELRMHRGPSALARHRIQALPHGSIGLRKRRQALGERLEVQHRSARDDRHASARTNRLDRGDRVVRESRRRVGFGRIHEV